MNAKVAHYEGMTSGGAKSDKVYVVEIRKEDDGMFTVLGKWGARKKKRPNIQEKGTYSNMTAASIRADEIFNKKLSKGYKDVTWPTYTGDLKWEDMTHWYEKDGVPPAAVASSPALTSTVSDDGADHKIPSRRKSRPAFKPKPQEEEEKRSERTKTDTRRHRKQRVCVCVDNIGMENHFNVHVEYMVAEPSSDGEFMKVYNRYGEAVEVSISRFRLGELTD